MVEEIKSAGGEATFVQRDVAREADAKNLVAKTVDKYGAHPPGRVN